MTEEIIYLNPSRQVHNIGVNSYGTEADNAWEICCMAKQELDTLHVVKAVYVGRKGMTLPEAIADSKARGATVHVDVHTDAEEDPNYEARGCTALYKSAEGRKLAQYIYNQVSYLTPTSDRGLVQRFDLGCLNQTAPATSALIELMFHSSPKDVIFFKANKPRFAEAIVQGILDYCGIVKPIAGGSPTINRDPNVIELQNLCNLYGKHIVVDGIIGPQTINAVTSLPYCGLRYEQPVATKYIQRRMNTLGYTDNNHNVLKVDGVFGRKTAEAVIKYQSAILLTSDGVVGSNTWGKLLGLR